MFTCAVSSRSVSRAVGILLLLAAGAAACGRRDVTTAPLIGNADSWLRVHPNVSSALVWEDAGGAKSYVDWSAEDRALLERAVSDGSQGGGGALLADPPVNLAAPSLSDNAIATTVISTTDAKALYFATVGRSLMLEITNALPWSVTGYVAADLAVLFDSRSFFRWRRTAPGAPNGGYAVYEGTDDSNAEADPALALNYIIPPPPAVAAQFLSTNGIVGPDRLTTIVRSLAWSRDNMMHFGGGLDAGNMALWWGYRGITPATREMAGTVETSEHSEFSHWTGGCPGTTYFLMAVLRAVNVPVRYVVVEKHAMPYFATEGKYLSHGDDPYSAFVNTASPMVNASELFIGEATFAAWFPSNGSPTQRLNNIGRRAIELGVEYLPDYLLNHRCLDRIAKLVSHADSRVYADVKRIYTVAALEALDYWGRLDAKLAQRGTCLAPPT
jgi:hypothetical protein